MQERHVICPKCGQSDAVAKVTAIVADRTAFGETSTLGMPLVGHDDALSGYWTTSTKRTALAARLSPPAKPGKPFGYGSASLFLISRFILAFIMLAVVLTIVALTFPFLISTYRQNPALLLIPVIGIAVLVVLLMGWMVRATIRDVTSSRKENEAFPTATQAWKHAMGRWNALYYCSRDDGVFLPSQEIFVPIAQMKPYLYQKPKEK